MFTQINYSAKNHAEIKNNNNNDNRSNADIEITNNGITTIIITIMIKMEITKPYSYPTMTSIHI
jgi:hypothetical protein